MVIIITIQSHLFSHKLAVIIIIIIIIIIITIIIIIIIIIIITETFHTMFKAISLNQRTVCLIEHSQKNRQNYWTKLKSRSNDTNSIGLSRWISCEWILSTDSNV